MHRGYMNKCYHKKCDQYNKDQIKEENFEFLSGITQSIMLSVIEMAMEKDESTCITKTVQYIIKKATSNNINNADKTTKPTKKPTVSQILSPKFENSPSPQKKLISNFTFYRSL